MIKKKLIVTTKGVETKNILVKSRIPLGGYVINPYVGCTHQCQYCYACYMKMFTNHKEPWGTFLDIKYWSEIPNPDKYIGKAVTIGTATDPYLPQEEFYKRTRAVLEQLVDIPDIKLTIITKSDLILRDIDLISSIGDVTVAVSINTLDEEFKSDMDRAPSIKRRLKVLKKFYERGITTVCFISPIFPGITDIQAIFEKVRYTCREIWLEALNLRPSFKSNIVRYIKTKRPDLQELYHTIYDNGVRVYWECVRNDMIILSEKEKCWLFDGRYPIEEQLDDRYYDDVSYYGHPIIIDYLFHEEVRKG